MMESFLVCPCSQPALLFQSVDWTTQDRLIVGIIYDFTKSTISDICTHRKCGIPSGETIELKILLGNETHKSFPLQFSNSCQVFRTKIRKRHGEVQDIRNPPQNPMKQVRDGHKLSLTTNHLWVTQPFLSAFLSVQYLLLPPSPLPSLPINSSHPSPLVSAISYIPLFQINFFSLQIPLFLQTVPSTQPTWHAVNFVVIIFPHTQILKKTWQESQVSCNFCVLDHS